MKRIVLIFIATACTALGLYAQPAPTYTLKSCLEQGLLNNYSLRIVRNEEQVSKNNATLGNAGYLPTLGLSAGYKGTIDNTETKARATGETTKDNGVFDQTLDAGINLNWTIFDGFNITANYQRLKELERQGETNTRIAIEDLIANIAAEYYNYVQQKIRLKNFRYAVSLSKERLRIVEERYHIGNFSRLDYQQAKVDFNADSAQYMKQQELLHTSRIQLNELMANKDVDQPFIIQDSLINVTASLNFEELWNATLTINASLLRAEQNNTLARLDYKKVCSRDYPYVKMNGGYGYTLNQQGSGSPPQQPRSELRRHGRLQSVRRQPAPRTQECPHCRTECSPGTGATGAGPARRPQQPMAGLPKQPANAEPGTPEPCGCQGEPRDCHGTIYAGQPLGNRDARSPKESAGCRRTYSLRGI